MDTIVCPAAPIIVGFSLGVLTVLVVQESDHFVQHRFGYRQARAEGRSCKGKSKVGANSLFRDKIFETPSVARTRIIAKIHPAVDLLLDSLAYRGCKLLLGQRFAGFDVAVKEKLVARDSDPVDVAKPAPDAHSNTMLGVIQLERRCAAPSQLRKRCLLIFAGSLDVHGRVAWDPPLAL